MSEIEAGVSPMDVFRRTMYGPPEHQRLRTKSGKILEHLEAIQTHIEALKEIGEPGALTPAFYNYVGTLATGVTGLTVHIWDVELGRSQGEGQPLAADGSEQLMLEPFVSNS